MKQIFRLITCMAVCFLMCGLSSCEDADFNLSGTNEAANSEEPSVDEVKSKVDELEKSINDIKSDFKGLKETSSKQDSILKTDVRVPQERIDSLQQSIDALKVQVDELEANNKEQKSSSNWGIIVVFILVLLAIGGVVYLYLKQDKSLKNLEKTIKDLDSLKLKVDNLLSNTNAKTKKPASSGIPNFEESISDHSRRLQKLEQEVKQLQVQSVASPVSQVQQAAPVVSKLNRHGYFKIPIMGGEGAYFDQVAEERSGAYFEVEYTDNSATFKPIAPYTQLNQNDDIPAYAVEFEGDQDNAQNYDCLDPGQAHLQSGRWVIDAKAKLKIY